MHHISTKIKELAQKAILDCYQVKENSLIIKPTSKEFDADFTIVIFPLVKRLKKSPQEIGDTLGKYMLDRLEWIVDFKTIKGFLNISLSDRIWFDVLDDIADTPHFGQQKNKGEKLLVEYSSPNTNKPLHLGHIRNILLGWSISNILETAGYEVVRTQIINDRGIAICKSMIAWSLYGENKTPKSQNIKGDLFVGNYYVLFDKKFNEEYAAWQKTNTAQIIFNNNSKKLTEELFFKKYKNEYFNNYSQLGKLTRKMLQDWENNDPDVLNLWKKMRSWVLEGFDETLDALNVSIDKDYFESETYLTGKSIVEEGLQKNIFYKKDDGSVWIDLEQNNLGQKIILRSDGTSVYITQDLGTADLRYKDYKMDGMIYVVGNEQDYHFQALFATLKALNRPYADKLFHLSYGMVDLPSGKMKSREGTVVDADDLIKEVIEEATQSTKERGVLDDLSPKEIQDINAKIGLAALKFFILKVQSKKRMVFDPKESVDMQGQTGPYIQNAFVRIRSIQRKANKMNLNGADSKYSILNVYEKNLIKLLLDYPHTIQIASNTLEPSEIANYAYNLAKAYHRFYHEVKILSDPDRSAVLFRLKLSHQVSDVLKNAFYLLGIQMPQKM